MQEKDIFISMKNTNKDAPILLMPATELTTKCNTLLSTFHKPMNGRITMQDALKRRLLTAP